MIRDWISKQNSLNKGLLRKWTGQVVNNNTLFDLIGKGAASVVESNCIQIAANITITLNTPRIGAIVTEINMSGIDTNGVVINGSGHIAITFASLTNPKIWQIKLSSGEEFVFCTKSTRVYDVLGSGNYGSIGGGVNDWVFSTQDSLAYNLQYGYGTNNTLALSDVVVNGNMEANDSSWISNGSVSTNVRTTEQVHTGTYARKFTAAAQYAGIRQQFYLKQGLSYRMTVWLYGDGGKYVIRLQNRADSPFYVYGTTEANAANGDTINAGWTKFEVRFTQTTATYNSTLVIFSGTGNTTGTCYVDDVSIVEMPAYTTVKKDMSTDVLGATITYPGGYIHNGCESKIKPNPSGLADLNAIGITSSTVWTYSDLNVICDNKVFLDNSQAYKFDNMSIYSTNLKGSKLRLICRKLNIDCRPGYIAWWQSNTLGRGDLADLPAKYNSTFPDCRMYDGTTVSPLTVTNHQYPLYNRNGMFGFFLPYLVELNRKLVACMFAQSATAVYKNDTLNYQDWNADSVGELLDSLKTTISNTLIAAKANKIVVDWQRIIHYGGETDGQSDVSGAVFSANYDATIQAIINHIGDSNELKIIMIRPHNVQAYISYVRTKFNDLASSQPGKYIVVDTDDLTYRDGDHLDGSGQVNLALRILNL